MTNELNPATAGSEGLPGFLRRWYGDDPGQHYICRIPREKGLPERTSVETEQGEFNWYLSPNPLTTEFMASGRGKAAEEDVAFLWRCHVDKDPGPDTAPEDAKAEWQTNVEAARIAAPEALPPSEMHNTGRMGSLYWTLNPALHNTPENRQRVKKINRKLAAVIGGDHCPDVAHLLKMPHTTALMKNAKCADGWSDGPTDEALVTDRTYTIEYLEQRLAFVDVSDEKDLETVKAALSRTPWEGYSSTLTDDQLISKAHQDNEDIRALWTADTMELAHRFPPNGGPAPYDRSRADMALCAHLAFWTGNHGERIDRLFRRSGLFQYSQDKWDRYGGGYARITINNSCDVENFYSNPKLQHIEAAALQPLPSVKELEPHGPEFTTMPEPKGVFMDIASWIYSDLMVDPQRDLAVLMAYMLPAAFCGRKDSLKRNPPVIQSRVLALNGTGKDALRMALEMIVDALFYGEQGILEARRFGGVTQTFGTKRMVLDDLDALSNLRIVSEAGLTKKTKAGDPDGVRAAMMQNFAQNAYSRRTYPGFADKLAPSYGVNTSLYEESTKETFMDSMQGQLGSGEAARMLSFRIDASAIGASQLHDDKPVPPHIFDIFRKLALEALRGEKLDPETGYISSEPVPYELRRVFTFTAEAEQIMNRMLAERTDFKRGNKQNEASLEWAQRVRHEQLVLRTALVIARTEHICGPTAFSPEATTVGAGALRRAIDVVTESRRTERANGADYESPLARLVKAMHKLAVAEFNRPEPSKTYRDKKHGTQDRELRIMRSPMFTGNTNLPRTMALELLPTGKHGNSAAEVLKNAAKEGAADGLWIYEDLRGRGWQIQVQ